MYTGIQNISNAEFVIASFRIVAAWMCTSKRIQIHLSQRKRNRFNAINVPRRSPLKQLWSITSRRNMYPSPSTSLLARNAIKSKYRLGVNHIFIMKYACFAMTIERSICCEHKTYPKRNLFNSRTGSFTLQSEEVVKRFSIVMLLS